MFIGKMMINDYQIETEFGMEYSYRIVQGYRIENWRWIEGVCGIEYNFGIVKAFRIFIKKGMLNDYWMVWVFGI